MGVPGPGGADSVAAETGLNYTPADPYTTDIPFDPFAFEASDPRNTAFDNLLAGMGRGRGGQLDIKPLKLDDSAFHLSKDEVTDWHSKHPFLKLPYNYDTEQWLPAPGVDEILATQISTCLEYRIGLDSANLFAKGPAGNYLINDYKCDEARRAKRWMEDLKESLKDPDSAKKAGDIAYGLDTGIIRECDRQDQKRETVLAAIGGFISIVLAFFVVGPKVHKWIEKPCDPKKETCPLPPPLVDYRGRPIQPSRQSWWSSFDSLMAQAALQAAYAWKGAQLAAADFMDGATGTADKVVTQAPVYAAAVGAAIFMCADKAWSAVEGVVSADLNVMALPIVPLQQYMVDESKKFGKYNSSEGF